MMSWKKIRSLKGFSSDIIDTTKVTSNEFVKNLRNKFNMSQRLFAKVLGVSEKTVEKWEQGVNPVKGATSRLLYLLDKHENLINDLYVVNGTIEDKPKRYVIKLNTYRKTISETEIHTAFAKEELNFTQSYSGVMKSNNPHLGSFNV